jgi:hypothetical protein
VLTAVLTLTLIAAGFLVATVVVIVLARTSTARWEKEKRPARVPRRPTTAGRAPLAATAARLPVAVARWVAAMRSPASRRAPLKLVAETLATAEKEVASRVGPFPRLPGRLRSSRFGELLRRMRRTRSRAVDPPSDDSDVDDMPVRVIRRRSRRALAVRRAATADRPARRFFGRTPRRPRRGALAFLHRHHRSDDPRVLHGDGGDGPPAP